MTEKMIMHIFYFFFYSCAGWLCESIYCSVPARKWINRGFLTGPLCPIYGTGALVFSICLTPVKENLALSVQIAGMSIPLTPAVVFIVGLVLADIVEYITSVIMEKLFHARWWDYSEKPFNLHGRICLTHSLYWGIAAVAFLYLLHPVVQYVISFADGQYITLAVIVSLAVLVLDIIGAVRRAADLKKLIDRLNRMNDSATEFFDSLAVNAAALSEKSREKLMLWRREGSAAFAEIRRVFDVSLMKKRPKKERYNRYISVYPALRNYTKKQISSIEDAVKQLRERFSDDESK